MLSITDRLEVVKGFIKESETENMETYIASLDEAIDIIKKEITYRGSQK